LSVGDQVLTLEARELALLLESGSTYGLPYPWNGVATVTVHAPRHAPGRPKEEIRLGGRSEVGPITIELTPLPEILGQVVAVGGAPAARYACATFASDLVVLDDGFQHRRLARDVDVVVLAADPRRQRLLPAGPRREHWRALARAAAALLVDDAFDEAAARDLLPGGALVGRLRTRATALVAPAAKGWTETSLTWLQGRRVVAVAGIARPQRFVDTLRALGATVAAVQTFPDHHPYTPDDIRRLMASAGADPLVTTEKDLVKLESFPALADLRAVRIEAEVEGGGALLDLAGGLGWR
jgi:tetraacyldisaccharide 4'-kinase